MYSFSLLKFVKEEGEDREGRREKEKGEGGKKGVWGGERMTFSLFIYFFFKFLYLSICNL